jgi:hypothetical protein
MPPLIIVLSVVLQFVCIVHAVRTGRPYFWYWIIIMGSLLGVAVYAFTQILPDLQYDPRARRAAQGLIKRVDPQRDLRRLRDELQRADTVANRLKLGKEFLELGEAGEAEEILRACLKGMHATDADIMLAMAQAQFAQDKFVEAQATLTQLIAANPDFRSADGHLLFARSLEALGRKDEALDEYNTLDESYPGEEARVRKAQLLFALGRAGEAKAVLEKTLARCRVAPAYYRRAQKQWIDQAKALLKA